MPRRRSRWIRPSTREDLDPQFFIGSEKEDPRNRGEGPCGATHKEDPMSKDIEESGLWIWAGNQHGAWANCPRCNLRMGYWPVKGSTGRYRERDNPEIVRRALANLCEQGWEKYSADLVRAEIRIVEARMALQKAQATMPEPAARPAVRRTRLPLRTRSLDPKMQKEGRDDEMEGVVDIATMTKEVEESKSTIEDLKRENKKLLQAVAEQERLSREKTVLEASSGQSKES